MSVKSLLIALESKLQLEKQYSKNEILELIKQIKIHNNETYGQTAEYTICKFLNLKCYISDSRIDTSLCDKLIKQLTTFQWLGPKPIESIGYKNGSVDFKCEDGSTLSLKTLKKYDGKICPQNIGQSTLKSWDKRMKTDFNGELSKNKERQEMIKTNLKFHLEEYIKNIFCCNHLLLIYDCDNIPIIEYIPIIDNKYFQDKNILLTRPIYEERWDEKRQKNNEYSTQVEMTLNEKRIIIGEFQFHKSSRKEIKFRFYKKFFKSLTN